MQASRVKLIIASAIVVVVFSFILIVTRSDRSRDLVLQIEPVDSSADITVYVDGAVDEPGLYSLPRGSRVAEALDMAGVRDVGETSGLERARVLVDGQTIDVPKRTADGSSEAQDASSGDSLDINQATEAELHELPGIGPVLAERIRQRRDQNGPYQSLDELAEISGISSRMVEEIREYASVGS